MCMNRHSLERTPPTAVTSREPHQHSGRVGLNHSEAPPTPHTCQARLPAPAPRWWGGLSLQTAHSAGGVSVGAGSLEKILNRKCTQANITEAPLPGVFQRDQWLVKPE